jgi:hypothetical protein
MTQVNIKVASEPRDKLIEASDFDLVRWLVISL